MKLVYVARAVEAIKCKTVEKNESFSLRNVHVAKVRWVFFPNSIAKTKNTAAKKGNHFKVYCFTIFEDKFIARKQFKKKFCYCSYGIYRIRFLENLKELET